MLSKVFFVTIDIGGTSLKSAVLNEAREVFDFTVTKVDAEGTTEHILGVFLGVLQNKMAQVQTRGNLGGIGLSSCIPFDSGCNIDLAQQKYKDMSEMNLRELVRQNLNLDPSIPIILEEDSVAFLRGEAWVGYAAGFNRVIGITLGEGLGSAYMIQGRIMRKGPGIPPKGELWCLPYEEGILDDKISRRGILELYKQISKSSFSGDVKELALQAKHGDANCKRTFAEFGKFMGQQLRPHIERFRAECVVIGGQIAKGFILFAVPLRKELKHIPSLKKVAQAKFIDYSPFLGLLKLLLEFRAAKRA